MPTTLQAEIKHQQQDNTDCGLFVIAYATELQFGHDLANFIFDQSQMKDHLFKCLTSKTIERLPKKQCEINEKPVFSEITANQNISKKWNIPNKISKSTAIKSPPNFLSENFYQPLFNSKTSHHDDHTNNKQVNNSDKKQDTTILDSANHFKFNSLVINLSNRTITETERTVLELGLTFCPSQKNFNKEHLSLGFFKFIR